MKIPITITVYLKINGDIYSELKNRFVLNDGAAPKIDIRAIVENMKNEIRALTKADTIEFITQEEYENSGN